MRHYIRVTAGPYRGQIYQFATKKDALALESALHRLRPHSTDYGNDRDGFPETHLRGRRASTRTPLREVRAQLKAGRAHATISAGRASDLKVGDAVQLRWEPGTGGVIRRLVLDDAWIATPRGERKVPTDALVRVRKEHEGRVRRAAGSTHARRKKLDPREAKQLLKSDGIDFARDFHELGSQEVQRILEVARLAGYRKRKDAPGSTARMYFQYLSRQP